MTRAQMIRAAAAYKEMTHAAIAESIGMSAPAFSSKLKRNTFDDTEMERIAESMGGTYIKVIQFPDGTQL